MPQFGYNTSISRQRKKCCADSLNQENPQNQRCRPYATPHRSRPAPEETAIAPRLCLTRCGKSRDDFSRTRPPKRTSRPGVEPYGGFDLGYQDSEGRRGTRLTPFLFSDEPEDKRPNSTRAPEGENLKISPSRRKPRMKPPLWN
jgi:hypothetical protein